MRLAIVFLILLWSIRLDARERRNPFIELGNFIYAEVQPMNCGFNEVFFTLTPEVARQNKLHKLRATDTIRKAGNCGINAEFNTNGLITYFSGQGWYDYHFDYDSALMSNGVVRISKVTCNEWSDGHILRRFIRRFTYDEFGNPTSLHFEYSGTYYYRYMNRIRYQYVFVTETLGGDTAFQVFKYDKRTGELFEKWDNGKFELRGVMPRFNGARMLDTIRNSDRYFDCIDTIPDGRYESAFINSADSSFYPIVRDSLGRFSEVRYNGWVYRKVNYSENGLPESVIRYEFDRETMIYSSVFTYSYY